MNRLPWKRACAIFQYIEDSATIFRRPKNFAEYSGELSAYAMLQVLDNLTYFDVVGKKLEFICRSNIRRQNCSTLRGVKRGVKQKHVNAV